MKKLNLENVRIYSNTKDDILDAMNLIGEEVFLSNYEDFRQNIRDKLTGVICAGNDGRPFFHRVPPRYKYFVLAKDVLPEEFKETKIDKAFILKEYEESIQKGSELALLLANFDSNKVFSHPSFALLWILHDNFCQNAKILETIAENEKFNEIYEIQRKHFNLFTSSTGGNHE